MSGPRRLGALLRNGESILLAIVLAIALTVAVPRPAAAAVSDCADAIVETAELAEYLVGQASKIGQCSNTLSTNVPATGAVGLLISLVYAAGEFSDEQTCKELIGSTISKMLAALLQEAPKVRAVMETALDQLPGVNGKASVQQLISDAGTAGADALAQIPGVDYIMELMACSCTVLGTAIETIEQSKEIIQEVAACVGTVNPIAAVEYLHCNVFGRCLVAGVQQQACDPVQIHCPPGKSMKACLLEAKLKSPELKAEIEFCYANVTCPQSVGDPGKPQQTTFIKWGTQDQYCGCPAGQGFNTKSKQMECIPCTGPGKKINFGHCETWTCQDKPGLKLVSYGAEFGACKYEPVCKNGLVWDTKTKSCEPCAANEVFVSYGSESSPNGGTCKSCAYDEYKPAGSIQMNCMKLQCKGLAHPDPEKPHTCVPCENVFHPDGYSFKGEMAKIAGTKPICLDGIEFEAKKRGEGPCKDGTGRFPDGRCLDLSRYEPVATPIPRKPGGDPGSRVRNPVVNDPGRAKRDTVTNKSLPNASKSRAPSLEGIGDGLSVGSKAPAGNMGPTVSPSGAGPGIGVYNRR